MDKNITLAQRQALASACGIADPYLYQILSGRREASPELCVVIERVSQGRFSRKMLRPTDWHLIWPELVGTKGAPAVATQPATAG